MLLVSNKELPYLRLLAVEQLEKGVARKLPPVERVIVDAMLAAVKCGKLERAWLYIGLPPKRTVSQDDGSVWVEHADGTWEEMIPAWR